MSTSICAPSFLRRIVVKNDDGVAQQYSHPQQNIHQLSFFKLSCFVQIKYISGPFLWYKLLPSQISKFTLHMQLSYWVFHNDWPSRKDEYWIFLYFYFKVPIITFMRASLVFPTDMSSSWSCRLKCTKFINLNKYKQSRSKITCLTLEL